MIVSIATGTKTRTQASTADLRALIDLIVKSDPKKNAAMNPLKIRMARMLRVAFSDAKTLITL
jgi:hypothetical protein